MARKMLLGVAAALVLLALVRPGTNLTLRGAEPSPWVDISPPQLITLEPGSYLLFGRYLDEPILWQVIAVDDGRPLLFSAYVLSFKAFSAAEHAAEISANWQRSTLRQWLNAVDERIRWEDTPPSAEHLRYNAYVNESGFLHDFTASELALIHHGGDRVFLLSRAQLQTLSAAQRRRAPTRAALAQDNSPYLFLRPFSWYWTIEPFGTNAQSVLAVTQRGSFYQSIATDGMNGVCPALYFAEIAVHSVGGNGSRTMPFQVIGGAP